MPPKSVVSPCSVHMCDELADFGRQAICMSSRIGRRTNGLYGMLVNMDRPLWRQSTSARARFAQSGWQIARVMDMGHPPPPRVAQIWKVLGRVGNDPLAAIWQRTAYAKIPNHADSCQQPLGVVEVGGWRLGQVTWQPTSQTALLPALGPVQVGERRLQREPSIGRVMMREAGSFTTALGMSCPEKHGAWSTASDDASCPRCHSGRPMAMLHRPGTLRNRRAVHDELRTMQRRPRLAPIQSLGFSWLGA